jgi:hypothetical protein
MMPVFPFIAGLALGVAAVKLYKNERVRPGLEKAGRTLRATGASAQAKLREAAVSGLSAIETSSSRLREKLDAPANAAATEPATPEAAVGEETPDVSPAAATVVKP